MNNRINFLPGNPNNLLKSTDYITPEVNSLGYRTVDFNKVVWNDSIVIFGCSYVFGVGLFNNETISNQLQELIGRPVINMGVPASSMSYAFFNQLALSNSKPYAVVNLWTSIAASSDMNTIVVCNNKVYVSLNGGVSWFIPSDPPITMFSSVSSSGDGTVLIAARKNGYLFVSTDVGHTIWNSKATEQLWKSVSSSYDGYKIVAVTDGGKIFISTDKGTTWVPRETNRNWTNVYVTPDGNFMSATVNGGQIYLSYDGGMNWFGRESNRNWASVRISDDGLYMCAVETNGYIYYSNDYGATWYTVEQIRNWIDVAMSYDGNILVGIDGTNIIHVSTNRGVSWTVKTTTENWLKVINTPNGLHLASCVYNGHIWLTTLTFA